MEYDLNKIITDIQNKDKISISYIQGTYSFGFPKASRIYKELIEKGYISEDGTINKEKVVPGYVGIKVIFLDVDGVLNCHSTKDRCCSYIGIDDEKVLLLKEIVVATGAKIVLVSSWKENWTNNPLLKKNQDELANYLDKKLSNHGLIISNCTNDNNSNNRGEGILNYIQECKNIGVDIAKFIIIDDEKFDYLKTKLTRYLIQTSFNQNGLEKKHVRKAIEKLC